MKKKVLLPTDFSHNSWNAICYAMEMFKHVPCEFHIINAYGYDVEGRMSSDPTEQDLLDNKEVSENKLATLQQKINGKYKYANHTYIRRAIFEDILAASKQVINEEDIDIVVMGTKGDTNAMGVVYGSKTIYLMEKLKNCPLLAVPTDSIYRHSHEIVFPTGLHTAFKKKELSTLIDLAQLGDMSIQIVHVSEKEDLDEGQLKNKDLLLGILDPSNCSFHQLAGKNVYQGIRKFVEERNSAMICFINKPHNFLTRIFRKTMSEELAYHSKVPVLALHDHKS